MEHLALLGGNKIVFSVIITRFLSNCSPKARGANAPCSSLEVPVDHRPYQILGHPPQDV
jgi:hypothetical protein